MTSSSAADKADPRTIEALMKRRRRAQEILAGDLPTTRERLTGLPPFRGSEADDRRIFLEQVLASGKLEAPHRSVVEQARDDGSAISVLGALVMLEQFSDYVDIATRLRLILAASGHTDSVADVEDAIQQLTKENWRISATDRVHAEALAIGLRWHVSETTDIAGLVEKGLAAMRRDASRFDEVDLALNELDAVDKANLSDSNPDADAVDDLIALALEDRAECMTTGLVVVPAIDPKAATGARKDIVKMHASLATQRLPIVEPADLGAARLTLLARFPHLHSEINLILRQRRPLRLLLVGSPGCGKTSLARDIARGLGISSVLYGCAGASDASFAGTSAQWNSARTSTPLQLIARAQVANPLVILDELDKSATSRHNGSLVDSLLPFLELSSARRILDPALEVEVDLSAVSYVATANDLVGVPAPLRDRFKIVRIPDPTWSHVGDLVRAIIDDIAAERELDRRWIEPLAGDELELVRSAWPGGSLRKLRRILELIIDGRESFIARA